MTNRLQATLAAMVTASRRAARPMMHLETTSFGFAMWWTVFFLLHGVNLAYYVTAAELYHTMPWSNTAFQLKTYSIGMHPSTWATIATIHGVVAVVHGLFMVTMIVGSLQARRLVFLPNAAAWMPTAWQKLRSRKVDQSRPSAELDRFGSVPSSVSSFTESSAAVSSSVFGRDGLLGVDSVYFDHLLLIRELIETTLQSIQVYRMTYLLPRVWLIRFYIVLLIANCWSTPLVHHYYRDRHVKRRMMSLLCDVVLDVVSSIGVSLWIFLTYVPQYTDPAFGFEFNKWFDDVWFTNMQQEFQMMMVVSWADMASRLVFAVGVLQCMESMKQMLSPTKQRRRVKAIAVTSIAPAEETRHAKKLSEPSIRPEDDRTTSRTRWSRFVEFVLEKAGPTFFVVLGLAILVVHIVSETRPISTTMPCQLQVRPWFVSKPACSLVELNCHQLGGITGSEASAQKAWNTFEFGATARVFVRHCPQLKVQPTIQQFDQVTAVKFYNTTIVSWSEEAAFVASAHSNMRAVFAIRTAFPNGELPVGLLSMHFPQGLKTFVTSATNLHTLPDNLHTLWPPGMTLSFDLSGLQVIPPALIKLNPSLVSVAATTIADIPRTFFEIPLLECVILSFTRIQELPRDVQHPSPGLYLMFLESTNVSTFWSWMEPFVHFSLYFNKGFFNAHGTRYCAERGEIMAGNRTRFSITTSEPNTHDLASVMDVSTPAARQFAMEAVVCEPGLSSYFPLGLQDAMSAIRN